VTYYPPFAMIQGAHQKTFQGVASPSRSGSGLFSQLHHPASQHLTRGTLQLAEEPGFSDARHKYEWYMKPHNKRWANFKPAGSTGSTGSASAA
jgi:hypothetical protein